MLCEKKSNNKMLYYKENIYQIKQLACATTLMQYK